VPLDIKIPTASLTLVPEGTDLTGKISVYAAFFRRDGTTSKVTKQELPICFPAESLPRRKQLTVKIAVTTNKRHGCDLRRGDGRRGEKQRLRHGEGRERRPPGDE